MSPPGWNLMFRQPAHHLNSGFPQFPVHTVKRRDQIIRALTLSIVFLRRSERSRRSGDSSSPGGRRRSLRESAVRDRTNRQTVNKPKLSALNAKEVRIRHAGGPANKSDDGSDLRIHDESPIRQLHSGWHPGVAAVIRRPASGPDPAWNKGVTSTLVIFCRRFSKRTAREA